MSGPGGAIGWIRYEFEDLDVLPRKPPNQRLLFLGERELNRENRCAHVCLRANRYAPRQRAREIRRQSWTAIVGGL